MVSQLQPSRTARGRRHLPAGREQRECGTKRGTKLTGTHRPRHRARRSLAHLSAARVPFCRFPTRRQRGKWIAPGRRHDRGRVRPRRAELLPERQESERAGAERARNRLSLSVRGRWCDSGHCAG